MSHNKTFKIELDVLEHMCLENATSRDGWLWHYKIGHLEFKDIKNMNRRIMVLGVQGINIPNEVCEECVQAKQHKKSFSKDT